MTMKLPLISLLAALPIVSGKVASLDDSNYAALTQDKIAFIKFFAPWCGHCKAMAADWEKLGEAMADKENVLIAEVDCTADTAQEICSDNGVQGFPTLKFGEPLFLDDYEGGRDFESMVEFAKTKLKPSCSPKNLDLCTEEQKVLIEKFMAMTMDELEEILDDIDEKASEAEEAFEESTSVLESEYEAMMEATEETKQKAKAESNYGMIKQVYGAMKKKAGSDEL